MDKYFLGLNGDQWLDIGGSVLIVLVVAIVGHWVVRIVMDRGLRRLVKQTRGGLDDAILDTVHRPLYWLAIVFSLEVAVSRLAFVPADWEQWLGSAFFVLYLLVGFGFAWRFVQNFFTWYGREMAIRTETDLDEQLMPFFRRVALIILGLVGVIILLGHFEVEVAGLITTLGIGSLAIALAAQEALADTISGFIIMIDRPFRIGDRIEIQDLATWGDVVDIGLRSSRIRTRDNRMVVIPNSTIGKSLIVNYAYPDSQYRIQIHIGVAYGTDLEKARRVMVETVSAVEGVLPDRPVEALFLEFGASALIFRVRWWLESYEDTRRMFDRVNTALYNALTQAGIELPYPQMDIHHHYAPGDQRPKD